MLYSRIFDFKVFFPFGDSFGGCGCHVEWLKVNQGCRYLAVCPQLRAPPFLILPNQGEAQSVSMRLRVTTNTIQYGVTSAISGEVGFTSRSVSPSEADVVICNRRSQGVLGDRDVKHLIVFVFIVNLCG